VRVVESGVSIDTSFLHNMPDDYVPSLRLSADC